MTTQDARALVVGRVADHIVANDRGHPLRVAVDGVTASGKTTLADELATAVRERGRPAIRLSMDGFHQPRAHRHRQGRDSADGYYDDAYDLDALARLVLVPLGPGGDRRYREAVIDLATDERVDADAVTAAPDSVLVVDGTFLQRDELADLWDEVVYVDTELEVARARGVLRDSEAFGGPDAAGDAYDRRYHAACRLYLADVDPLAHASVVVRNDDLANPVLRRIGRIEVEDPSVTLLLEPDVSDEA